MYVVRECNMMQRKMLGIDIDAENGRICRRLDDTC